MSTIECKKIIKETVEIINDMFNQLNPPELYKVYNINTCAVIFWGCGTIIAKSQWFQTVSEDDCYWRIEMREGEFMSNHWLPDYAKALGILNKYLEENGKPFYYVGTNVICGYEI